MKIGKWNIGLSVYVRLFEQIGEDDLFCERDILEYSNLNGNIDECVDVVTSKI